MFGVLMFNIQLMFSGLLYGVAGVRAYWMWLSNAVGVAWAGRFILILQVRRCFSCPHCCWRRLKSNNIMQGHCYESNAGPVTASYNDARCPLIFVFDDNLNKFMTSQVGERAH
jgi:hypothetical protein